MGVVAYGVPKYVLPHVPFANVRQYSSCGARVEVTSDPAHQEGADDLVEAPA